MGSSVSIKVWVWAPNLKRDGLGFILLGEGSGQHPISETRVKIPMYGLGSSFEGDVGSLAKEKTDRERRDREREKEKKRQRKRDRERETEKERQRKRRRTRKTKTERLAKNMSKRMSKRKEKGL